MASSAEQYVTARAKVDAFRRQFDDIAKTLDKVATALHDLPERFAFINLRQPRLPMSAFGNVEVDALKFPSATEIQNLLAEFHKAYLRCCTGRPRNCKRLAIIESQPRGDSEFVFAVDGAPVANWSRMKRRLDELAGLPVPFVLHDLRRSTVTGLARIGVELPVIERIVNHASGTFRGIVSTYQKYSFEPDEESARSLGQVRRELAAHDHRPAGRGGNNNGGRMTSQRLEVGAIVELKPPSRYSII